MCAHVPVDLLLELLLGLVDLLQYGTCIVQLYSCSMYTYSCTCMVPVGLVVVPILNKRKLADFDIICAVFLHFLDPQIGHSIAKISGYSPEPLGPRRDPAGPQPLPGCYIGFDIGSNPRPTALGQPPT